MFRSNALIRNAVQHTVLLTAALGVLLFVGCRNTGGQSTAVSPLTPSVPIPPDVPPPVFLGTNAPHAVRPLSEQAMAFRPITPETVAKPSEETPAASPPNFQQEIDDLNTKIASLEKKLVEKDKTLSERDEELKRALLPTPTPDEPKPLANAPAASKKAAPALPIIGIPGVVSAFDGENVRVRIPDTVLFQPGTMRLTPDGEDTIRSIAAELRTKYPNGTLEIEGHTDSLQTDPTQTAQKHEISTLKSQVVFRYFTQSLKWKPETISVSGHGFKHPVADNGTPEGRAQNNRIELVVKGEGSREQEAGQ